MLRKVPEEKELDTVMTQKGDTDMRYTRSYTMENYGCL